MLARHRLLGPLAVALIALVSSAPAGAAVNTPVATSLPPTPLAPGAVAAHGTVTTTAAATAYFVYFTDPLGSDMRRTPAQAIPAGSTDLAVSAPIFGFPPGDLVYEYLEVTSVYGTSDGREYGAVMPSPSTATTDPATDVTATSLRLMATFTNADRGTFSFAWGTNGDLSHTSISSTAQDGSSNYIGLVDLPARRDDHLPRDAHR